MLTQIGVGAAGANANLGGSDLDTPQFAEVPDVDELARRQFAGRIQHHHVGATCNRKPRSWLVGTQGKGFLQRAGRCQFVVGRISFQSATSFREALSTASNICTYPVQRQRFPERPSRISSREGCGVFLSRCTAARIMPGVQMPHCAAPHSRKAFCRGCKRPSLAKPSMVTMFEPAACSAGIKQLFTSTSSIKMEHEPHSPSPQPSFVPIRFKSSRSTSKSLAIGKA